VSIPLNTKKGVLSPTNFNKSRPNQLLFYHFFILLETKQ